MRFKRIAAAALCLVLIVTASVLTDTPASTTASAKTVEEYQSEIKDLEAEQREIEAELKKLKSEKAEKQAEQNALRKKIDNLQSQINVCNNQIKSCDDQIAQLEKEIEEKQVEYEKTKYVFRQRLRAIYMSGGTSNSTLSLLFNAKDLEDLLAKTELTKSVSAYDRSIMEKILDDVNTIESKKAEIDKLKAEQESAKATLAAKKKELDAEASQVGAEIGKITGNANSLDAKSKALEKAIAEYEEAIRAAQHVGKDQTYDGQFTWPVPGYHLVISPYGYRIHPITGRRKFHKGTDISGGNIKGKPIVAMADGVVSIASYNQGGYGNYVMINHGTSSDGNSYVTLYAHMTRYIVSVGQKVTKGQTIGYVGTTGASTGYHLHFEVRVNGNTTNPMSYF